MFSGLGKNIRTTVVNDWMYLHDITDRQVYTTGVLGVYTQEERGRESGNRVLRFKLGIVKSLV